MFEDEDESLTDEFLDCFQTDEDCTGGTARLVAMGLLPQGVDAEDQRVKDLIERCKRLSNKGLGTEVF